MLTKTAIGNLSVEQQELLAQMECRKTQRRLKLLEQARGLDWRSRYFPIYAFFVFLVFVTAYYFNFLHLQEKSLVAFLPLGVVPVFALFAHNSRTNRRLDALLELLDFDREQPQTHGNAKDEQVG
jgi:hypothetical protein